MIKKLRRKFVVIAMSSLLIILIIIIGIINGINFYQINGRADHLLQILSENDGVFPRSEPRREKSPPPQFGQNWQMTEETPFETRYFSAKADGDGNILQADTSHIAAVTEEEALAYAQQALEQGNQTGYLQQYKYQVTQQDTETLIVFIDRSSQLEGGLSFLLVSCFVGAAALLVMLFFVSVFSKWAIRPVAESMEKQKQFITDAGHELKTPLSIIAANADVLELQSGSSEWLDSIRGQISRLNKLVNDMLTLSKMDEEGAAPPLTQLDVSAAVRQAAEPFAALAEANGKTLEINIQPNLSINGNAEQLRQLVSILLDNAVKYAAAGSKIQLTLAESGRYVRLDVRNVCDAVPQGDLRRLFDRFYRVEQSRSRQTGGYGIGLSVAQAIVRGHKGKISTQIVDGNVICFTTLLTRL
ncbi:MAG TPA: GHKL domain-containing protein [Candidatus Aphodoplasma excrementigallinarum]|uniref:histidine kinase n=1 Tax=Candidatus Aphodoplasma excrementigallinarum TaxID=2840673 RepID=A0A9D1SZR7_9FIRM|nr:GHKL domain-containing protein [Candidatus Aphodoplasma excrementigallinarum]